MKQNITSVILILVLVGVVKGAPLADFTNGNFAFGLNNKFVGTYNLANGNDNNFNGNYNFGQGLHNDISGDNNFADGYGNVVKGQGNIVSGQDNIVISNSDINNDQIAKAFNERLSAQMKNRFANFNIDSNNPYQNQQLKSSKDSQQVQNMFSQTTGGSVPFQPNYGNAQNEGYQTLQRFQQPNFQNMLPTLNLPQYSNFGVNNVKFNQPENFGSSSILNDRGSINLNTPPINPMGRENFNIMSQPSNMYQGIPGNSAPFYNNYQAVPNYQFPFSFPQQVSFQQYQMKPSTPYQQLQNPSNFASSSYLPKTNYQNPLTGQSNTVFPYSATQTLSNQAQSYKPNLRTNVAFQQAQQNVNGLNVLQNMMGKR